MLIDMLCSSTFGLIKVKKGRTTVADNELVHAAWAQRRADRVGDGHARSDIMKQLAASLARVGAFAQQNDLRLLTRRLVW